MYIPIMYINENFSRNGHKILWKIYNSEFRHGFMQDDNVTTNCKGYERTGVNDKLEMITIVVIFN